MKNNSSKRQLISHKKNKTLQKGLDLFFKGNHKEAVMHLREVLESQARELSAELKVTYSCMVSQCYKTLGDHKESLQFLYKAVSEEGSFRTVHHYIITCIGGLSFSARGMIRKNTLSDLKNTIAGNNDFGSAVTLAITAYLADDIEEMKKQIGTAQQLKPEHPYLIYCRARYYSAKREYSKAIALYDQIHALMPNNPIDFFVNKHECFYFLALDAWRSGDLIATQILLGLGKDFFESVKSQVKKFPMPDKSLAPLIDIFERERKLFSEIIFVDEHLQEMFEAKSLSDVFFYAWNTVDVATHTPVFSKILDGSQKSLFGWNIVLVVGLVKVFCANAVVKAASALFWDEAEKDIDSGKISACRKVLIDTEFVKAKQAIDAVESFVSVVLKLKEEEAFKREKELLELLKPGYVLCRELSQFMAGKEYQEGERNIQEMIRKEINKGTETITQNVAGEIRNLCKQINSSQRFREKFSRLKKKGETPEIGSGVKEYDIYIPQKKGFGVQHMERSETLMEEEFLGKKHTYDVFIFGRSVQINVGNKQKPELKDVTVQLQERAYKLLVMFLKYKNDALDVRKLFVNAWANVNRKSSGIPETKVIKNDFLKKPISQIETLLEPFGFEIETPKNSDIYMAKGSLNYCMILDKTASEKLSLD